MLISKFLPKEFDFFDLFEKQIDCGVQAAGKFKQIVSAQGPMPESAYREIEDIEHKADKLAHTIIDQLNKTFITPFDREDIFALTKELDDIVDMIDSIVNRLRIYKMLNNGDKHLIAFAEVIEKSVIAVSSAVRGLRTMDHELVMEACVEVNRLENVGDDMRDSVLGELFESSKNPIDVIKWKEIYADAEELTDICEDIAHVVESILVKQS